ncbi:beta-N-acetylhexosaminidase [Streptomyces sp. NPDC050617]|uniref:beta-N-acetylhexosaminidase n=1 Tax=Streptomyces sp. NPDC050617 TaxID=3154628 RepID=UPI0034141A45
MATGTGSAAEPPGRTPGEPRDRTPAATPLDRVIPAPASVRPHGRSYELGAGTRVRVPAGSREAQRVGDYLADLLRPATGYALPVTTRGGDDGIRLRLADEADESAGADETAGVDETAGAGEGDESRDGGANGGTRGLGAEGYRLSVTHRSVTISARTAAGLFHGVQTLRQLLPADIEKNSRQAGPWPVAGGAIVDVPRYAYRGGMLDVGRHFFTVDQVKRYIDQLALYKINKLHLHLSEDQGWRIAIDSWPRLATYGGSTQVGGGPGGYYTKDDYREITRYAQSRYLTVIPEIDLPSHTNAALASYAQLNCDGVAPPLYTGTEVGFSTLCARKQITYDFLDDVIRELAALTPGPYLHIGGDEAYSTHHEDYVTIMDKAQPIVAKYGKTVVGWHQLTGAHLVKGAVAQYWGYDKTPPAERAQVAEAAKRGAGVILSPADRSFLDMKYTKDTPLGLHWAGLVEVKRAYDWNPGAYLAGVPESSVLGVEAALWTETLATTRELDFMAFPRLPGIAELGWSPASTHDWDAYRVRLAAQAERWDALGFDYYRTPQVDWPSAR